MAIDITDHPDAPDPERLGEFIVEPVPLAEIDRLRDQGETLREDNLLERDDLGVKLPRGKGSDGRELREGNDVGTYLYRYTQLFGSPQVPEYFAGEDISERTNVTFKYLLEVTSPSDVAEEFPEQWLMTVFDWKVDLGVAIAEWHDEPGELTADSTLGLTALQLAHNIGSEPVTCEFADVWY
jgi:hypothetical protein